MPTRRLMKGFLADKKKKAAFFLGLAFLSCAGLVAIPSLAWLSKAQTSAALRGIGGKGSGSYFNGGDGSKEAPFEIDNARQLYYFNWLQDLGIFNDPNDGKTAIKQIYFKLTSDIDGEGYSLPPAGTEQYPFVGSFDGNGHTISNLTITNDYSELTNVPARAEEDSEGNLKQAEIVGFFGVVGSTSDESKVNGYSYDTSANEIKNLGLSSLSIVSASSSTLVGLAAGYVNGTLSGVGVNGSSIATKSGASPITDITGVEHVSEYSLVGYATDSYLAKTLVSDETMSMPQVENPNTSHGSTNWGGSVDMEQMYNDIKSEQSDSSITNDVYYVASETIDVDPSGNESQPKDIVYSSTKATRSESGGTQYYFKNGQRKDEDGGVLASYGITTSSTYDDTYVFIYGTPDEVPTSSSEKMSVKRNVYGYLPTISKSGHFLSVSEDGTLIDVSSSGACGWNMPSAGGSGYIYTYVGETAYYLSRSSSNSLYLTSSASTTWTYEADKGNIYSSDDSYSYYLDYDETSSAWTLVQDEISETYLTILDTYSKKYIGSSSSGTISSSDSVSGDEFKWAYDSSSNGYRPLTSSTLYLCAQRTRSGSSSTFNVIMSASTNTGNTAISRYTLSGAQSDGTGTGTMSAYLKGTRSSYTVYLYYGSSSFAADTSTSSHSFTIAKVGTGGDISTGLSFSDSSQTGVKESSTSERNAAYYVNPTYVPLAYSYSDEDSKTGINGVSEMNTGYLVGGANFIDSSDYAGDIRVSKAYKMSSLKTSFNSAYNSSNLQVVTRSCIEEDGAYSDSGWSSVIDNYNSSASISSSIPSTTVESSKLKRYDSARYNLESTIFSGSVSSSTALYGLHFMNAQISTDHLCQVGKAIVYDKAAEKVYQDKLQEYLDGKTDEKPTQSGSVYSNYDVPEDSIDFNLATEGYINFFGGSYFNNNTCFFSLNEVVRDENNSISEIKQISKIYANLGDDKKEKPYLYSYDGSVPANSSSSQLVFDVSWIASTDGDIISYCLYYFEIPVNAGEYALGSVSGKSGAYLLYLDIGTGAADYEAVTIKEKTTSNIIKQNYPKGVDFTSSFKDLPSLSGGGSACVALLLAPSKGIDYSYESNVLTSSLSSGVKVVYSKEGVSVKDSAGTALPKKSDTPLIVIMERETSEKYNPVNTSLNLTYSCTWTISGASKGDEIQLYFLANEATWKSGDESVGVVSSSGLVTMQSDGSLTITATGTASETASSEWQGPETIIREETFGEFKISLDNGEASVEYVYDAINKTYVVTVHCSEKCNATIISTPSDSSYSITINGNAVTGAGQVIAIEATE